MDALDNEILLGNQPQGFLEQLGGLLKKVVGLGEISVKDRKNGMKFFEADVRTKEDIFGKYTIFMINNEIFSLTYSGKHPSEKTGDGKIWIGYVNSNGKNRFNRMDGLNYVEFPHHPEMTKSETHNTPSFIKRDMYDEWPCAFKPKHL